MDISSDTTKRPRPRFYDVVLNCPSRGVREASGAILIEVFGWSESDAKLVTESWLESTVLVCQASTTFEVAQTWMMISMGRLIAAKCPASCITIRPVVPVDV